MPTIKYYVREGLLPAGQLTSPNQASYDEAHVRRLRLVRALLDVGGLSVAGVRAVIEAVEDVDAPLHKVLGAAADRVVPRYEGAGDEAGDGLAAARETVAELVERRGWTADPASPAAEALAAALAALDSVGHGSFAEVLDDYADAAEQVARTDLDYVSRNVVREELVESVVVGTVLGDALFAALRRLAHVEASRRLYGTDD
ncbi:MerR family transcriptional regulator [Streptomyces sp. NPDC053493]|uniref:MerR family transcriptional regulator n=1 Tax=Streptomyces sp. NPDC053493 TaxID=3365705 RepID=UPI0037CD51AA